MYNSQWYQNLIKPPFSPPDSIFAPVWTILYSILFAALILYIIKPMPNKKSGYILFAVQLGLNLLWSPVFFAAQNIPLAAAIIILLDIFVLLTVLKFYSVSKPAGILIIPYFLWCLFASYLNIMYFMLN